MSSYEFSENLRNAESLPYDLSTSEGFQMFEASLLSQGLFRRLPFRCDSLTTHFDDKTATLWRVVLDVALRDFLVGKTVDARRKPLKGEDNYKKRYRDYLDSLKISGKIYQEVVLWLYGGTREIDRDHEIYTKGKASGVNESSVDFDMVCELAILDTKLVKETFVKLKNYKRSLTSDKRGLMRG